MGHRIPDRPKHGRLYESYRPAKTAFRRSFSDFGDTAQRFHQHLSTPETPLADMAPSSGQDFDGRRLESTVSQSIAEHVANLLPYMMARGKQEAQRDELLARQRDLKEKERDKSVFPSLYEDAVYRCKEAEERAKNLESRVQMTADASQTAIRRLAESLVSSIGGQPTVRDPRSQAEAVVTRKEIETLRNSIATQNDLQELSRRLEKQAENVLAQQKAQINIVEQIKELRRAQTSTETHVGRVKTENEDTSRQHRETSSAIVQQLEGLQTTTEANKQSFGDDLNSLQQELRGLTQDQHERTTFGESLTDTLRQELEDLKQEISPLKARLANSEKTCFEMRSKLDELEGKNKDLSDLVKAPGDRWVQRLDTLSAELEAIKNSQAASTQVLGHELRTEFSLPYNKHNDDPGTLRRRLDAQGNASSTQANLSDIPRTAENGEKPATTHLASPSPSLYSDLESCKTLTVTLSRKVNAVELHLSGLRSGQDDLKTSLSQVNDHLQRNLPIFSYNIERLMQTSSAMTQRQAQITSDYQGLRHNQNAFFHNHNTLVGRFQQDLAETKTQFKQAKEHHSSTMDAVLLDRSGRETFEDTLKKRLDSMDDASKKQNIVTVNRNAQLIRDLTDLKRDIAAIRQEQALSRKGPGPPTPAISSPNLEDDPADSASDSEPLMARGEARRLKRKRSLETEAGVSDGSHTTPSVKKKRDKHVARMNVSKGGTRF